MCDFYILNPDFKKKLVFVDKSSCNTFMLKFEPQWKQTPYKTTQIHI